MSVASNHEPPPPAEPEIHRAARLGDLGELRRMVDAGANINFRFDPDVECEPWDVTPLIVAAKSTDGATVETLKWLVGHGADIHMTCGNGMSAAWHALDAGGRWDDRETLVADDHAERLRYLFDLGLDPNEASAFSGSLLCRACEIGDPARVRLLLDCGADAIVSDAITLQPNAMMALASLDDDFEIPNPEVLKGTCAGEDVPIFCAARSGSAACVRMILDAGADPNARDDRGSTPLMVVGSAAAAAVLLDAGADVHVSNELNRDALDAPFDEFIGSGAVGEERFRIADLLINAGIDLHRVRYKSTRLDEAARRADVEFVRYLLDQGLRTDEPDEDHETPLFQVCWQGGYGTAEFDRAVAAIISMLVDAGAPIDHPNAYGARPIHLAAGGDGENPAAIRMLLDLGVDPNITDRYGDTPLIIASERGHLECVRILLDRGADPHIMNQEGKTALDVATEQLECWKKLATPESHEEFKAILKDVDAARSDDSEIDVSLTDDEIDALNDPGWRAEALADAHRLHALVVAATNKPR